MRTKDVPLGEYTERLAAMMAIMQAHIDADKVAFESLTNQLIELNKDVKSIIAQSNYVSGVWKTLTLIGGTLLAFAGLYIAYIKH